MDATARILAFERRASDTELEIELPRGLDEYFVEKGSIAVDGISMTIEKVYADRFKIGIIPTTWEETALRTKKKGSLVNLETDVIGKYVRDGKLERVRKGIYIISQGDHDEFALILAQHSQAVFSFGTALFLWGMSDRTPHFIDVTFPQGVNASVIRRDNPDLRCHYVQARLYGIGIAEKRSPQGAMVRLYDRERCICDLVRGKNILDKNNLLCKFESIRINVLTK